MFRLTARTARTRRLARRLRLRRPLMPRAGRKPLLVRLLRDPQAVREGVPRLAVRVFIRPVQVRADAEPAAPIWPRSDPLENEQSSVENIPVEIKPEASIPEEVPATEEMLPDIPVDESSPYTAAAPPTAKAAAAAPPVTPPAPKPVQSRTTESLVPPPTPSAPAPLYVQPAGVEPQGDTEPDEPSSEEHVVPPLEAETPEPAEMTVPQPPVQTAVSRASAGRPPVVEVVRPSKPREAHLRAALAPRGAEPSPDPTPRKVPEDTSSAHDEADELFSPRGTDRSPQAWAARLMQASRPPARQSVAAGERTPDADALPLSQTEPLSQETRQFLRPHVGIDPQSVRVHRSPRVDQALSDLQADALALDDEVAVHTGQALDTPAGKALLAHELTHVAQGHNPRFVPPIARERARTVSTPRPDPRESSGGDMEESTARQVESAVSEAAVRAEQPSTPAPLSHPLPAPAVESPTDWGGLPAPWEPLPDWLAPAGPASQGGGMPQPIQPDASPELLPPVMPAGETLSITVEPRLAESDRPEVEEPPAPAPSPPAHHGETHVEPDLDALARQVYSMLKRRLEVERRRAG